jgi:hypothetical protein
MFTPFHFRFYRRIPDLLWSSIHSFGKAMPRRPPPTQLRLLPATAPLPGRGVAKHKMPSMPCPIFQHPSPAAASQRPRSRSNSPSAGERSTRSVLPPLVIPGLPVPVTDRQSPVGGTQASGYSPVVTPVEPPTHSSRKRLRGPWDHSGSISLKIDLGTVLTPPKRAAVSP